MDTSPPTPQGQTLTTSRTVEGGTVCRVTAAHQLSAYESQALQSELLAAAQAGGGRLAVDMTIVEFMSSAALGVLVTVNKECARSGHRLALFGLRKELLSLLKMTHLDRLFKVCGDEAAALRAVAGR